MPTPSRQPHRLARAVLLICAALFGLLGLALLALGGWLAALGGSPYYLVAGVLACIGAALLARRRHAAGVAVVSVLLALSVAWSVWEIHGKGWMPSWGFDLAGRVGVLAGLWLVALAAWLALRGGRTWVWPVAAAAALTAGLLVTSWERPGQPAAADEAFAEPVTPAPGWPDGAETREDLWSAYAGSNRGQRFAIADQVTPHNVAGLAPAWTFNTGDLPPNERVSYSFQNTPLKIGGLLYVCSNSNQVFALDPATGAQRWHFDPQVPAEAMEPLFSVACRSLAHHPAPARADAGPPAVDGGDCPARIFVATIDSRLIALDAATGAPCTGFGDGGTVDLGEGMGNQAIGFSSTTSGPMVVADRVIVGQQVSDNQRRDAPSGVVRAFDARSGALLWAWDAKRPDPQAPLAPGEVYPRGTPNVWSVISADESLGLVYLPTGNAANDHYGGDRAPGDEEYASAVVAVDVETGATRWHFRSVDHDLWDYEPGAQPTLLDMQIDGNTRRALLLGTKTGSIFVLDAATGEALWPVERLPAPQGAMPGDWTAPTQPQSTGFPNFAGHTRAPGLPPERLDESHAFGLSPVDAAWCRIQFRRMRYEGIYTPPTDEGLGMLLFPGTVGGLNWGGLSVNPERQILVTNQSRLPNRVQLVPREDVEDRPIGDGGRRPDQVVAPQAGAPWGVDRPMWLSPLGVPCIAPPWGYVSATDLRTGALLWTRPLGTGFDVGPLGLPTFLRIPIGTPNIGGPLSTRSGLTFIAAAQDNWLRAFETGTGRLLWSGRLPASAQATPMTYVHGGRQYVVVAAGGHAQMETRSGDAVVAFALPQ